MRRASHTAISRMSPHHLQAYPLCSARLSTPSFHNTHTHTHTHTHTQIHIHIHLWPTQRKLAAVSGSQEGMQAAEAAGGLRMACLPAPASHRRMCLPALDLGARESERDTQTHRKIPIHCTSETHTRTKMRTKPQPQTQTQTRTQTDTETKPDAETETDKETDTDADTHTDRHRDKVRNRDRDR